jgi:iron-sulfur cluster insertion protein
MNDMTATPGKSVTVTARAARRVAELVKAEGRPGLKLRVAVNGGGCSGFSYGFDFDEQVNDDDLVIERDGVTVLVDSVSLDLLAGSEVDYVEDLIGSSFKISNPNATASCGCGTSFSI